MRLHNYTKIDTELLREIIRHCVPSGVSGFDIAFKNSRCYHGIAYAEGCTHYARSKRGYHKGATSRTPYVIIYISRPLHGVKWKKPFKFTERGAYLGVRVFSEVEAVVNLVAHELRHLWQRKVPRGYRVWGSRGQYSERDADAYSIRKLREWRRLNRASA